MITAILVALLLIPTVKGNADVLVEGDEKAKIDAIIDEYGSIHNSRKKFESGSQESVFDVVIIGAGVSGLETARLITSRSSLSVAIVEARSRIGGRVWAQNISSTKIPSRSVREGGRHSTSVDMGANWIHGSLLRVANEFDLDSASSSLSGPSLCTSPPPQLHTEMVGRSLQLNPLVSKAQNMRLTLVEYPFQSFTDPSFFNIDANWWRAMGFWAYKSSSSTLSPSIYSPKVVAKNWARFCLLLNVAMFEQRQLANQKFSENAENEFFLADRVVNGINMGRLSGTLDSDDEALLYWFIAAFEDDIGETMSKVHPIDWDNPPSLYGGDFSIKEGMSAIVRGLLPAALSDLQSYEPEYVGISAQNNPYCSSFAEPSLPPAMYKLFLGEEVTMVEWRSSEDTDDNRIDRKVAIVHTSSAKIIAARHAVVVTVPLGVLQSNDIKFEPRLPSLHLHAIKSIGLGHSIKVSLHFDKAFWPEDAKLLAIAKPKLQHYGERGNASASKVDDSTRFKMYWSLLKTTGEPILVVSATGDDAVEAERWSMDRLKLAVLTPLESSFGKSTVRSAQLLSISRSEWSSDRFSKGAYSYPKHSPPVEQGIDSLARATLTEPVDDALYFAGEATSDDYYGTVHGAILSAKRVSRDVLFHWSSRCAEVLHDSDELRATVIKRGKLYEKREMKTKSNRLTSSQTSKEMFILHAKDLDDPLECARILLTVKTISRTGLLEAVQFHDLPTSMVDLEINFSLGAGYSKAFEPCALQLRSTLKTILPSMNLQAKDDVWDATSATSFSFANTGLSDIGAIFISKALALDTASKVQHSQPKLSWKWDFSGNSLRDEGAKALVKSWLELTRESAYANMLILDLSDNEISSSGAELIRDILITFGDSIELAQGAIDESHSSQDILHRRTKSNFCLFLHDNDINEDGLSMLVELQSYLKAQAEMHGLMWCMTLHENDDDTIMPDPCALECAKGGVQNAYSTSQVSSCDMHNAKKIVRDFFESKDAFSNLLLSS